MFLLRYSILDFRLFGSNPVLGVLTPVLQQGSLSTTLLVGGEFHVCHEYNHDGGYLHYLGRVEND